MRCVRMLLVAMCVTSVLTGQQVLRMWLPANGPGPSQLEVGDFAYTRCPFPMMSKVEAVDPVGEMVLISFEVGAHTITQLKVPPAQRRARENIDKICGLDCFVAGTPVTTPAGPKPIENLRAGEPVTDARTGTPTTIAHISTAVSVDLVRLSIGDDVIDTTRGHHFATPDRGWVAATRLCAGDRVHAASGRTQVVRRVEHVKLAVPVAVYDVALTNGDSICVGRLGIVADADARHP